MQNINHPNIIRLYESVDTLTKINLVVEYGGKLSLLDYLKENYPLAQRTMRSIGKQLLSALVYLHDKNIVHRDLKLQNVLMMGEQVKIIDFGFSTLSKCDLTQPTKTGSSMPFAVLPTIWLPSSSAKKSTLASRPTSGPTGWSCTPSLRASTPSKRTATTSLID